jgi:MORN repeat variant
MSLSMKFLFLNFCVLTTLMLGNLPAAETPAPAAETKATPAPSATPTPATTPDSSATPKATPTETIKRTALYSLDYDEENDSFLDPATKKPFSGPVESKYDNGVLESQGTLKDGHEEGLWTEFFEDGTKSSEGEYKGGKEVGDWKYWHENGQLSTKGSYKNGSAVGEWFAYFESGKPDSEGVYVDGLMDGDWKYHDEQTGAVTVIKFDRGIQLKP